MIDNTTSDATNENRSDGGVLEADPVRRSTDDRPRRTQTHSWAVAAPFIVSPDDRWISDFATTDRHRFHKVAQRRSETSWHSKKVARTGPAEWLQFHATARRALSHARDHSGGVVTVFPQLPAAAGLQKRAMRLDAPIVSWFFNTNLGDGSQRALARTALGAVDRFVVHASAEIEAYASALELPTDRFTFVPVQYGGDLASDAEDVDEPFVFATGSGFRDYRTMFDAVEKLGLPAKIVAGDRILEGLRVPDNVEVLNHLKRPDIHRLMRKARVNVIPLTTEGLTAGIITVAETYRHGRGLVITRRNGLEDYVVPGVTALQAEPGDVATMADSIEALWSDAELRAELDRGAAAWGEANCSDEAAAANLVAVLDDVVR